MRRATATRFFVLLALVLGQGATAGDEGPFLDDPKAALRQARTSQRLLLIEFHTTWCEACEKMRRTTWRDHGVLQLMDGFVALSVDGDRRGNLVQRYGVTAYPTIVLAEPEGAPILLLLGYQDARSMRENLAAVLDKQDELSDWAVEATSRGSTATALVGLGDFALVGHAYVHAERCFRQALREGKSLPDDLSVRARAGLIEVLAATDRCREAIKLLKKAAPAHATDLAIRTEQIFKPPDGICAR